MEVNDTDREKNNVKPVFTAAQRWLLVGVLILGLIWDWAMHTAAFGGWSYGSFWTAYLILFYWLNWNGRNQNDDTVTRLPLRQNRMAWVLAGFALALCGLMGMQTEWSRYGGETDVLLFLDMAAIPLLLMIHMAFSVWNIPAGREWTVAGKCLQGFFVWPFSAIPQFFGVIGSLFRGRKGRKSAGVGIGLAAGIPLTAAVLALLTSADAGMERLIGGWISNISLGNATGHICWVLLTAMLFYAFLYNEVWNKHRPLEAKAAKNWHPSAFAVIMGMLAVVYGVFAYVQFQQLFGGKLPAGSTYSAYAREGFWQLIVVTVINFSLIGVSWEKTEKNGFVTGLTAVLLAANALLLASAVKRLLLYIGAYGLTMMRILPLWLMVYLAILVVLFVVRLFREKLPLTRIGGLLLVGWFVALNVPNWNRMIMRYNNVPGFFESMLR